MSAFKIRKNAELTLEAQIDVLHNKIESLQQENQLLKERLEGAVKVIKFYSASVNWWNVHIEPKYVPRYCGINGNDLDGPRNTGGKRARAYLEKWRCV